MKYPRSTTVSDLSAGGDTKQNTNRHVSYPPFFLCVPDRSRHTRSSGMEGLHSKDVETEKGMVRGYVQQYASEIAMLLSRVDRQLLLLFKMNDCLR